MVVNVRMVSRIAFGRGCFEQLDDILLERRQDADSFMVFLVDDVFSDGNLRERIPLKGRDELTWVNVDVELFRYKSESPCSSCLCYGGKSPTSCSQEDQLNSIHNSSPKDEINCFLCFLEYIKLQL